MRPQAPVSRLAGVTNLNVLVGRLVLARASSKSRIPPKVRSDEKGSPRTNLFALTAE